VCFSSYSSTYSGVCAQFFFPHPRFRLVRPRAFSDAFECALPVVAPLLCLHFSFRSPATQPHCGFSRLLLLSFVPPYFYYRFCPFSAFPSLTFLPIMKRGVFRFFPRFLPVSFFLSAVFAFYYLPSAFTPVELVFSFSTPLFLLFFFFPPIFFVPPCDTSHQRAFLPELRGPNTPPLFGPPSRAV